MSKNTIEIKELIKEIANDKKDEWKNEYKSLIKEDKKNLFKFTMYIEDISEIKIHKILYFLHGFYQSKFNENIFKDPYFESWKYGPVEIIYRNNKSRDIFINENEKWVKEMLFNLMRNETTHLIDLTHSTDPWIKAGSGKKFHEPIKDEDIREF